MKKYQLLFLLLLSRLTLLAQQNQFILFDVEFTFTKEAADNSTPSKSHFYVKGDWTSPVDYRNGTVHVRIEVLEKPDDFTPTTWSLCYIPNQGQGNGYGCTSTGIYLNKGIHEKDIPMTSFWENESIIWSAGIKQMDLVIKDDSGGQGHAHKRDDHENYFPTRVRISMIQVAAGDVYDPKILPLEPKIVYK
jgi:hypothetical protein